MSEGIGEGSPTDTNTTGIITAKKTERAIFFKNIFPHRIYHNQFDNRFGESQKDLPQELLRGHVLGRVGVSAEKLRDKYSRLAN